MASGFMLAIAAYAAAVGSKKIDFQRDVAPILEQRCFECHYPGTSSSGIQLTGQ